jgi:hypothetical protein
MRPDPVPDDPYADLIQRVLAEEIPLEVAARQAADLLQQSRTEPHGFSLDFRDSSPAQAKRLKRFADLVQEELLRRLTS